MCPLSLRPAVIAHGYRENGLGGRIFAHHVSPLFAGSDGSLETSCCCSIGTGRLGLDKVQLPTLTRNALVSPIGEPRHPFFGSIIVNYIMLFIYLFVYLFPTSLFGVLVFDSVSRRLLLLLRLLRRHLCIFQYNFVTHHLSHTHNFVTHHLSLTQLCHTSSFTHNFVTHHLSHTHTHLCHTSSFTHNFVAYHLSHTHNFVAYHLSHTSSTQQLCHTPSSTQLCNFVIFHTQLSHTQSVADNFVSYQLSHTTLPHTIFHTQLCHTHTTLSHTHNFVTHHLSHTTSFCVAGVVLGDMCLRFTWQAWHLVTYTFVLRCRRGTWRHLPLFCVAGVALGDIHLRFA